jgi:hypothetical protein
MIKLIHQIWIQGPKHFEENRPIYFEVSKTWKTLFPDYEYKLWGEAEYLPLIENFSADLLQSYKDAPNFSCKSDFARFVILYNFGGLYVDTDYEPFKRFDFLFMDTDLLLVKFHLNKSKMLFADFIYNQAFLYAGKTKHKLFENMLNIGAKTNFITSKMGDQEYTMKVVGPTGTSKMIVEMNLEHDETTRIVPHCMIEISDFSNVKPATMTKVDIQNMTPFAVGVHRIEGSWIQGFASLKSTVFACYNCISDWDDIFLILLAISVLLFFVLFIIVCVKWHIIKRKLANEDILESVQ